MDHVITSNDLLKMPKVISGENSTQVPNHFLLTGECDCQCIKHFNIAGAYKVYLECIKVFWMIEKSR